MPTLHNTRRTVAMPGPGRPTAARVETINRTILVAARAEFVNSGFEAARMEAIATAAGVSKGTLYGRYPTKEALLRGVIADQVVGSSQDWEPDAGALPTDLRQRLKHRARRVMEYCCSGKLEQLERLFASSPCVEELRRVRYEVGHRRTVQTIAQDIIDRTRGGSIPPGAAIGMAEMLIAMLYGWWRMKQEIRRVTPEEGVAFAEHAVDVLFDSRAAWDVSLYAGAQCMLGHNV
jgi:TetR/AcrR family transcriptional regulator, mexJK operon transcriptional repressor